MPITWRNIDIGSNQSANQLINAGGDQIVQGISGLGDIVGGINKVGAANVDARTDVNTENAVATLAGITDSKTLAEAMGAGGALNKDTLRSKVGAEIDLNKVSSIMAAKQADLAKQDTDAQIRKDDLEQANKDRIDAHDKWNKTHQLQKDTADLQRKQLRQSLDLANRGLQQKAETNRLEQAVMTIHKTYGDPAKAEAEIQKLITNLPASGFTMLGAGDATTTAKSISSIYKAGPVSQQFMDTVDAVNRKGTNALDMVNKEGGALLKQFKSMYKINDQVVKLQQDNSLTPGAGTVEIVKYLFDGAKDPQSTESDNVANQWREVENIFKNNGVKNPSSAVIKEAFMRSQADDGIPFSKRDKYSIDKSVVRDLANETAQAEEFISGGLRKQFDELSLSVLSQKESVLNAQKEVGNLLKLKQAEEQKIISTQGADAQYTSIKLDDLNELRYIDNAKTKPLMITDPLTKLQVHAKVDPITAESVKATEAITKMREQLLEDAKALRTNEEKAAEAQKSTIKKVDEAVGNSPFIKANPVSVLLKGGYE